LPDDCLARAFLNHFAAAFYLAAEHFQKKDAHLFKQLFVGKDRAVELCRNLVRKAGFKAESVGGALFHFPGEPHHDFRDCKSAKLKIASAAFQFTDNLNFIGKRAQADCFMLELSGYFALVVAG